MNALNCSFPLHLVFRVKVNAVENALVHSTTQHSMNLKKTCVVFTCKLNLIRTFKVLLEQKIENRFCPKV